MDVQFSIHGVNPVSVFARRRDLSRAIHHYKFAGFDAFNQPPDMNMDVALGPNVITVVGDSPAVAPLFLRFVDRLGPQGEANFGREVGDALHTGRLLPRQRQQTIRFLRIRIRQEEYKSIARLLFGYFGEAALTS